MVHAENRNQDLGEFGKQSFPEFSSEFSGGPKQVFRYLGRYTHQVAISNHRITALTDDKVTFCYKDYKNGGVRKHMTLDAVEFLRRFLLHVLPRGFVRVRHYGLCASANVNTKLVTARRLLKPDTPPPKPQPVEPKPWWEILLEQTGFDVTACPRCGTGHMQRLLSVQLHVPQIPAHAPVVPPLDTS